MKKNIIALAALATCMMSVVTSCEKKAVYVAPTFSSITVTPNPCHEGDTLTAVLNYSDMGDNWYYTKQYFYVDNNKVYSAVKAAYSGLPNPPKCTFIAPAAGTHTIKFSAEVSPTAGDVIFTNLPDYSSTFTVAE